MKRTLLLLLIVNLLFISKESISQHNHEYNPGQSLAADKSGVDDFEFEDLNSESMQNEAQFNSNTDIEDFNYNPFKNLAIENEKFEKLSAGDVKIYTTGNEAVSGSNNVVLCVTLKKAPKSDYMIPLDLSGSTAVNGIEIIKIPDYIIFKKGEQNQCLIISPTSDKSAKAESILKIRAKTSETTYSDITVKVINSATAHTQTND